MYYKKKNPNSKLGFLIDKKLFKLVVCSAGFVFISFL